MAKPYIATDNITIGTALGYVPGDEVPANVAEANPDRVARADSKAAQAASKPDVKQGLSTGISDQVHGSDGPK